jgi:preprotein translocase subunit SecB
MNELTFKLVQYRLNSLHLHISDNILKEAAIEFSFEISCSHSIKDTQAVVLLNLHTVGEKLPFTIETSYQGIFEFNQDLNSIEKTIRDKTIKVNCASFLLPFIRETIAETSRKAGFPPLILPPTNFLTLFGAETMTGNIDKQ